MKQFKLITLLFSFIIILSSCNKDDDENNSTISGDWKITDFHGTSTNVITFNDIDITMTSITEQTMIEETTNAVLTFNNDNTYTVNGSLFVHSVTNVDGTTTQELDYESTPQNGTWTIDGDNFTVVTNGTTATSTIVEFSDTTLTLKSTIHDSQDSAAGNSTTDAEFIQTYTKQ